MFDGASGKSTIARIIEEMGDNSIGLIMHNPQLSDRQNLRRICCLFTKETPCHLAAKLGHHRLLAYLISQKAYDKYAKDISDKTVLDVYAKPRDLYTLQLYETNIDEM
ncbi:hypothetical protein [Scale drop disease virus]|nr:hypothetical protein [Scale drop disease virus]QXJ13692.1 ORF100L [Scale drop disease virus]UNH60681.1 hypothetical protein SDDV_ORF012 [Scale drop disease virus]